MLREFTTPQCWGFFVCIFLPTHSPVIQMELTTRTRTHSSPHGIITPQLRASGTTAAAAALPAPSPLTTCPTLCPTVPKSSSAPPRIPDATTPQLSCSSYPRVAPRWAGKQCWTSAIKVDGSPVNRTFSLVCGLPQSNQFKLILEQ